jgi:hypothetical protein
MAEVLSERMCMWEPGGTRWCTSNRHTMAAMSSRQLMWRCKRAGGHWPLPKMPREGTYQPYPQEVHASVKATAKGGGRRFRASCAQQNRAGRAGAVFVPRQQGWEPPSGPMGTTPLGRWVFCVTYLPAGTPPDTHPHLPTHLAVEAGPSRSDKRGGSRVDVN